MKKALIALTVGVLALGTNAAFGHGAKPQHGGVVASANDLSYELVAEGTAATIYVVDHDKPADTSGMSGKLTVLNGSDKSEVELKPAGGNKLEAKPVKLAKGAKAVASIAGVGGKVTTVRFSLK
jgi:hypothetical protein